MKKDKALVVSAISGEITSDKTLGINDRDIIDAEQMARPKPKRNRFLNRNSESNKR